MSAWQKAVDTLNKLTTQKHMVALRDGMIGIVPVILIGSTFLLLGAQNEVVTKTLGWGDTAFGQWYTATFPKILIPYRFTLGLLSLYVAFSIAFCLAKLYELPPLPQALGAVGAFLVTVVPFRAPEVPDGPPVWVIPMKALGGEGLFLAIFTSIATVEISRRIIRPPKPKSPEESVEDERIPPAVGQAFASFGPLLLMVAIMWTIRHGLGFDIQHWFIEGMKPLETLGDSVGFVAVVNMLMHIMVVAGVHAVSVINAAFLAMWQNFLVKNAEAHLAGQMIPYITAYPFFQWFVWIGGSGVTLPAAFMLLFSRSAHMRRIGRISFVPSIFNVNEPFLFGLPVVANPILGIPCVLAPVAVGIISFTAMSLGIVGRPFIEVPWVLPCFIGSFLATQDWRAVVLVVVNLVVAAAIWAPFLRAYEKKLLTEEDSAA